jgi:CopG family transcriptional regulator / antitoxin EndoAI
MSTQNVRLNVTLPKDLANLVDQMSGERKRSLFIAEAIKLKIKQLQQENLEKQLAEGYRVRHQESLNIASEFETMDLEGWDEY